MFLMNANRAIVLETVKKSRCFSRAKERNIATIRRDVRNRKYEHICRTSTERPYPLQTCLPSVRDRAHAGPLRMDTGGF
jgi:hypothetical protein